MLTRFYYLSFGEYPLEKATAMPVKRSLKALDINQVNARSYFHILISWKILLS
jgi:hypothetical protein